MKKSVFVLALFSVFSFARSQSVLPLLEPGKVWSIASFLPHGGGATTSYYKFEGDTLVNGHHYYKTYVCNFDSTLSNWKIDTWYGLLREDPAGRVYTPEADSEFLLYDFSLLPGDSIFTGFQICSNDCYAYVNYVDSVMVSGTYRKRIVFSSVLDTRPWIEGIGSLSHVLDPYNRQSGTGWNDLLCVNYQGNLLYQNPLFESCYYLLMGTPSAESEKTPVTVNPNPVHQTALISIQNAENEYWLLEVFNAAGTVVRRFPIIGSQFLFNRDGLTPGLYLMKLTSNQRSFVVKLLVE